MLIKLVICEKLTSFVGNSCSVKRTVPVPIQKNKELVITKIPLDPKPEYIIWFYLHMRKLGYKTYPTLEEAYYMGQFWLRKARRKFPERKYRFALGEPVYVVQLFGNSDQEPRQQMPFTTLEKAHERAKQWKAQINTPIGYTKRKIPVETVILLRITLLRLLSDMNGNGIA